MSNLIQQVFKAKDFKRQDPKTQDFKKNQSAFVGYFTVGDGGLSYSKQAACALIQGGVNILELGVPFSDPIADGPVIQEAMTRALATHTTIFDVLQLAQELKQLHPNVPLIVFSYLNPILAAEQHGLFADPRLQYIDGLLIVDLPIEEAGQIIQQCQAHQLQFIPVITPATPMARVQYLNQCTNGFIYYACRKGTTGVRQGLPEDFVWQMENIKRVITNPIVAGFGVADRDVANTILQYADGFVVGSRFVQAMAEQASAAELTALAKSFYP